MMSLVDCYMTRIEAGAETVPYRDDPSNAVGVVVEGSGASRVEQRDFCLAAEGHFQHAAQRLDSATAAGNGAATLFVVTDREVQREA